MSRGHSEGEVLVVAETLTQKLIDKTRWICVGHSGAPTGRLLFIN